jgi:hypothetical protein
MIRWLQHGWNHSKGLVAIVRRMDVSRSADLFDDTRLFAISESISAQTHVAQYF